MLVLPIKKKWFDMILSGVKKEEYRNITPYYKSRFLHVWKKDSDVCGVIFRNGYSGKNPSFTALCTLDIGEGNLLWGAESGKKYYRLHIKEIRDIR